MVNWGGQAIDGQHGRDTAWPDHNHATIGMVADEEIAGSIESDASDFATEAQTAGGHHGCRASPRGNLDQIATVVGVIDVSRTIESNLEGKTQGQAAGAYYSSAIRS